MKVLITGATGFIGKVLVKELISQNFDISIVVRKKTSLFSDRVKYFVIEDFENNPDFSACLAKVDCVIHLAGRAHDIEKVKKYSLNQLRKINTELTVNLAKQALKSGVKRFLFLSSIGVNGNQNNQPFLENDIPNPQNPYAISKYEAEQSLLDLSKNSSLEVVIIRPPVVYGNNAPGNFGRLIKWVSAKFIFPLPLGAVRNKRALIAIDNLVSFIITCTIHPNASNEIFLISDNEVFSTTQLLRKIAKVFNKKPLLFPVFVSWMILMARLLGKKDEAERLFSSLTIDISKARDLLEWDPITTMDEQLCKIKENEKSI
jgi:nucleoside-diphosphate-sugar epimerase